MDSEKEEKEKPEKSQEPTPPTIQNRSEESQRGFKGIVKFLKGKLEAHKTIINIAIAGFALIISWRSCAIADQASKESKTANIIASNALEQSKQTSRLERRPYVSIRPVSIRGDSLNASESDDELIIEMIFELKNIGPSPAYDVTFPEKCTSYVITPNNTNSIEFALALPIQTIPPGESIFLGSMAINKMDKETRKKRINEINSGSVTFLTQFSFSYRDNLLPKTNYWTIGAFQIRKKQDPVILKFKME